MTAAKLLEENKELARRREESSAQLERLRYRISADPVIKSAQVTIFSAGSLGRLEAGGNSDLDVFVVAKPHNLGRLTEVRFLAKLADLNDKMGFPPFSDEMRYMKVYDGEQLIQDTGKPRDDSENSFTTRMLLLLESAYLYNEPLYQKLVDEVCSNYFRDNKGKRDFRPLFLINDLLRYWRTLCLNYEQCREDTSKPWRKKNMNLRFSRLTTVFSTVALLMVERPHEANVFRDAVTLTPLDRLARAVDGLNSSVLTEGFGVFLADYAAFLRIKDSPNPEKMLEKGDIKDNVRASADRVAEFFARIFADPSLKTYARYLTL